MEKWFAWDVPYYVKIWLKLIYCIYLRISRPAFKPTPFPRPKM